MQDNITFFNQQSNNEAQTLKGGAVQQKRAYVDTFSYQWESSQSGRLLENIEQSYN